MYVRKVGIVGAGAMGHAIAEVMAYNGLDVVMKDIDQKFIDRGLQAIDKIVTDLVNFHAMRAEEQIKKMAEYNVELTEEQKTKLRERLKPKFTEENKKELLNRIKGTTSYEEFADVDIAIEAAFESMPVKKEIFVELDKICPSHAVLATNTSALSVTEIAATTKRPGKVIGLHFFNPPYMLPLVEIVPALQTSEDTINDCIEWLQTMRNHRFPMVPIRVKESPGFLVNRLLIPILNEAVFALQEGIASARDIDMAMKAGAGMPMGPFELADMVGIDIAYSVAETLYREFGDPKYRPAPYLKQLVRAGRLGKKTGRGFYEYTT